MRRRTRACTLLTAAVIAAAIVLPRQAAAEPIALTVTTTTSIQQAVNRPCIIGDPSCHNPDTFSFTLLEPRLGEATVSSPTYTAAQIAAAVGGNTFEVGVDLNQAMGHDDGAYQLAGFTLTVNGTVLFSLPSITLFPINAGNGYSDALIEGFDLSGIAPNASLVFTATFSGATAGREQYFLRAVQAGETPGNNAPVPEPASLLLVGSGLAGALLRRYRRRAV